MAEKDNTDALHHKFRAGDDTEYEYPGRSPDADWREAATERIDKYRKGDLEVHVTDDEGVPIEGVPVHVEMTKHAFGFGVEVDSDALIGQNEEMTEADTQQFQKSFHKLFNKGTINDGFPPWKWDWGDGTNPETQIGFDGVQWLVNRDVPVHGHTILWMWPGRAAPEEILKTDDDTELRERMTEHAFEVASELAWGIDEWDVINHPVKMDGVWHERFDSDPSAWVEWLNAAREGDPEAKLFINEAAFRNDEETERYRERYYDMIEYLLEEDAEVDGVGFMGHFSPETLVPPEEALDRLDRFAEFGLEIQFTEYDFSDDWSDDEFPIEKAEQLQADYTRDFYIYTFSHPAVTSVITWGIWEPTHWRDRAAFFREDWSTRPVHDVYKELVFDRWWTEESGETDSVGSYELRGFKGEYIVQAIVDDKTRTATVTVDAGTNVVEL
ncbi:hypothetical protein C5C07_17275 [Haloferax sp. Atlit-4N]|uniref:endo-1,4-beta-xylanase n=1 Tax=Haloferax sp. Atlit-4N TaxID=2077206 RepID=UPI000E240A48|nr:endo-1,4-beta-xylanase [Haloferax sp. Atlit-4N]RDZ51337.1 hypothetical protein C5C07_17275 [Haloferax sp. Atlit-4N]